MGFWHFATPTYIGIGGSLAAPPLPHHRTYGSRIRRFAGLGTGDVSHLCRRIRRWSPSCWLRSLGATPSELHSFPSPKARYLGFDRVADARPPHPSVLPAFRPSAELVPPTMPSADFCAAIKSPCGDFSLVAETQRRPPEVRPTAFAARPPDLPPRPLMTVDFAKACSLVRPGRPRYPVLVHRAAALLHASFRPASRQRPCASLILHRHQAG